MENAMTGPSQTLLLFGATGDLSRRMLLPSLFGLDADGLLPAGLAIYGTARGEIGDEGFRETAAKAIEGIVTERKLAPEIRDRFLARLHYVGADASSPETLGAIGDAVRPRSGPLAIFLSTAPSLFEPTIAGLEMAGLAGEGTRLALEKPLGQDLASSREINDAVARVFPERRTFRIDHYLGKETVQNLLALALRQHPVRAAVECECDRSRPDHRRRDGRARGAHQLFRRHGQPARHGAEPHAPAARAGRDGSALRNSPPLPCATRRSRCSARCARWTAAVTREHSVIGQYTAAARSRRKPVPGYARRAGQRRPNTETFVALKAHVDNWRWQGVPFYLRTGKRLPDAQAPKS
jgi:glucose-6-phosphate 1-dehydrogenase